MSNPFAITVGDLFRAKMCFVRLGQPGITDWDRVRFLRIQEILGRLTAPSTWTGRDSGSPSVELTNRVLDGIEARFQGRIEWDRAVSREAAAEIDADLVNIVKATVDVVESLFEGDVIHGSAPVRSGVDQVAPAGGVIPAGPRLSTGKVVGVKP